MKKFLDLIQFIVKKYFRYTYPFIILCVLMLLPLISLQPIIAGISLIILIILISREIRDYENRIINEEKERTRESEEFESVTKHAIFHMPYPLVMADRRGVITWQNAPFTDLTGESTRNTVISEVIPAITLSELEKDQEYFEVSYRDRNFVAKLDKVYDEGKLDRYLIYLTDVSEYRLLEKTYYKEGLAVMLVFVDNLDEVKSGGDEAFRTKVQSMVDTTITNYFTGYDGIVRKYENDKYLVVVSRDSYNKIKNKKFDILDEMREKELEGGIPITLSIGVSDFGDNPNSKFTKARSAIDVALGRGGDQAVCVTDSGYDYFGGKTKASQKHTKVKARVIGYALRQLIENAENIYVSGHRNPDMDAIGSAVGVMSIISGMGKSARLVLGDDTVAIDSIIEMMKKEAPEIYQSIISPEEARNSYKHGDLLILTDHHKPSLSPSRELSEEADNVVIIDHHRRADEFIKNPALVYLEPHASSTSELVTEILQYIVEDRKLSHFESSALLAGIMLDTKNFTTQTGTRTFEAAGVLARMGADPEEVKLLFRDDFNTFVNRARAIENAEMFMESFAISVVQNEGDEAILTAAQASDELLHIDGVEASFALAKLDGQVHISARSMGTISVQLIMEKLGGGGHIAQAGARVDGDIPETIEKLKEAIKEYVKEDRE